MADRKRRDPYARTTIPIEQLPIADIRAALNKDPQDSRESLMIGSITEDLIEPTEWVSVTPTNSTPYNSSIYPIGYKKDVTGNVHLRGMLKSVTENAVLFTLPLGCIPDLGSSAGTWNTGALTYTNASGAYGQGDLYIAVATGEVKYDGPPAVGASDYVSLHGISFPAARA